MTSAHLTFIDLLQSGFQHYDGLRGVCQFVFDGPTPPAFHVVVDASGLQCSEGVHSSPTATVKMPAEHFADIVSRVHEIDFRIPEIIGRIEVTGDPNLVMRIGDSIMRPAPDTVRKFSEAEEQAKSQAAMTEIQRVHSPAAEEVVAAFKEGRPMIATGLLDDWPALNWSLDELKKRFGRYRLRVTSATQSETMGDFIDQMERAATSDTLHYSGGCILPPAMWSYFPRPFADSFESFTEPQIWMGTPQPDRPVTPLHRDHDHGFLGQIFGRKKLTLYSPDQAAYLYPYNAYNYYQSCWVDPSRPDYDRFPRFRDAQSVEFVLGPGELLIQPVGWFHCVYALDPVMSVSYGAGRPIES